MNVDAVKALNSKLVGGGLFAVLAVVGFGFAWNEHESRFFSSPTASRELVSFNYDSFQKEVHRQAELNPCFAELMN
ncbi:MAG: hypothetical protein AAF585_21190, partial [Verrucomicrobiota bacterium]